MVLEGNIERNKSVGGNMPQLVIPAGNFKEIDPTVPEWAKQPNPPKLSELENDKNFLTEEDLKELDIKSSNILVQDTRPENPKEGTILLNTSKKLPPSNVDVAGIEVDLEIDGEKYVRLDTALEALANRSGGSSKKIWKKVAEVEVTDEEVTKVYITQDINENPLNIDKSHRWFVHSPNIKYLGTGYIDLQLNKFYNQGTTASVAMRLDTHVAAKILYYEVSPRAGNVLRIDGIAYNSGSTVTNNNNYDGENITKIGVNLKSGTYYTVGAIISIYEEVDA